MLLSGRLNKSSVIFQNTKPEKQDMTRVSKGNQILSKFLKLLNYYLSIENMGRYRNLFFKSTL